MGTSKAIYTPRETTGGNCLLWEFLSREGQNQENPGKQNCDGLGDFLHVPTRRWALDLFEQPARGFFQHLLVITAHALKAQRAIVRDPCFKATVKTSMLVKTVHGQCINLLSSHIDLSCYLLPAVAYSFCDHIGAEYWPNSLTLVIHRTYGIPEN